VTYSVEFEGGDSSDGDPTAADELNLTLRAASTADAQRKATAALAKANAKAVEGTITVMGDPRLVAGVTFDLTDMGKFSAKYIVDVARHRIERGAGWTAELNIKRADAWPPPAQTLAVYGKQADGSVGVVK
jgi:phage protein D